MGWVKIDNQFTFNRKVIAAGNAAAGAWVRLLAWASAQMSDGVIPQNIASIVANQAELDALLNSGLLDRFDQNDYQIHDYLDYQISKEEIEEKSEEMRRLGKRGANAKWRMAQRVADKEVDRDQDQDKEIEVDQKKRGRPRGVKAQLSADWKPSETTLEFCRKRGVDGLKMVDEFTSYWLSRGDSMADWDQCFRNSVLRQISWGKAPMLPPPPPPTEFVEPDPDAVTGPERDAHIKKLQDILFAPGTK